MEIHSIEVGPFQVNCYIVRQNGLEAIVVDPGSDADTIASYLRRRRLRVAAYYLTHGHVDHISALADLADIFPAPVVMHPHDGAWAFDLSNQMPPFYNPPRAPKTDIIPAEDGGERQDAGLLCRIVWTPGHTPGGVCFHFPAEGVLFTGDTLFQGSVGRTDLPGGHTQTLMRSLTRLLQLPPETRVYPGHGPNTTLAIERQTNTFL